MSHCKSPPKISLQLQTCCHHGYGAMVIWYDMSIFITTTAYARWLFNNLQENIQLAWMEKKAMQVQGHFSHLGEAVKTMVHECEEPTEAIEETWSFVLATLRDRQQMDQLRQVTKRGLERIIKTMLPCRIKLLCAQFVLLPRLRWPLTIYEVPIWRSKNWSGLFTHLPKSG